MENNNKNIIQEIINLYENTNFFKLYGLDFWIVTIFTIICLILLIITYIFSHFQKIKQNWKNERCNPFYMPFAGYINSKSGKPNLEYVYDNFKYCNKKFIKQSEHIVMEPIYFMTQFVTELFNDIKSAWEFIAALINMLKQKLMQLFNIVVNRLISILIPIQNLLLKMKDSLHKMTGTLVGTIYTFYMLYKVLKLYLLNVVQIIIIEVLIYSILLLIIAIGILIALIITWLILEFVPFGFIAGAALWVVIISFILLVALMIIFIILVTAFVIMLNNFSNDVFKDVNTPRVPVAKTKFNSSDIKSKSDKSTDPLGTNQSNNQSSNQSSNQSNSI